MNYKKDYIPLIAIISYLATTSFKSGTHAGIAKHTSLDQDLVRKILEQYKEFFVEVPYTGTRKNNPYFTLHLRYGLRRTEDEDIDETVNPLSEEYTLGLINLISQRIQEEENAKKSRTQNLITMIVASIAAISAIVAAILSK